MGFSRANDTYRWRMLFFQSPLNANEIWIIWKATCFRQKNNHNKKHWKWILSWFQKQPRTQPLSPITQENNSAGANFYCEICENFKNTYFWRTSANDWLLLWFEIWHCIFFFFSILHNSTANSEVCIKVRTMSIILNVFQ